MSDTMIEKIAERVEASMCVTYGSQHPEGRREARISADDWASVLAMLRSAPEPVLKSVERILDEESAWISRPNRAVTERIAIAATIAAHVALTAEISLQ